MEFLKIILVSITAVLCIVAFILCYRFIKKIIKNGVNFSSLQKWYGKIGKKVKQLAMWIFLVGAIFIIVSGIVMFFVSITRVFTDDIVWILGIFFIPIYILVSIVLEFVATWLIYAFGELVDDAQIITKKLDSESFYEDNIKDSEDSEKASKVEYFCPSCDAKVAHQSERCNNCGQKLDWT
ncbi:MAG: hypothetical protein E7626_02760 [Ruminococcaceae bacterium]|nr:hypothetical protein [Oscillospiraceae bacterium]